MSLNNVRQTTPPRPRQAPWPPNGDTPDKREKYSDETVGIGQEHFDFPLIEDTAAPEEASCVFAQLTNFFCGGQNRKHNNQ